MKIRKKIQWGSISLLLLCIISLNLQNISLNPVDLQALNNYEDAITSKGSIKSSDYSSDFTGNGEECNVTFQQSLIDSSPINILNTSDPLNNTFYEPCPTVEDFPSSSTIMSIEDIYAPNKTIILEEGPAEDVSAELGTIAYFTSFTTKSSCLLVNASFALSISGTPLVSIYLYKSYWNSTYNRSEPDVSAGIFLNSGTPTATGWYEFDLLDTYLNNSETENNTWFLCPYRSGGAGTARWRLKYTGTDNSEAYTFDGTLIHLSEYYLCKVGVAPYISPPTQTLIVEDDITIGNWHDCANTFVSFEARGVGYIENISFYMVHQGSNYNLLDVYIFESVTNNSRLIPQDSSATLIVEDLNITNSAKWFTATNIHYKFNSTTTDNDTYFLYTQYSGGGLATWSYALDQEGVDGIDESIVLDSSKNLIEKWGISQFNTVDLALKVGVTPFIPNEYQELELETSNAQTIYTDEYAFSFKVNGPCMLDNFSLCFTEMWATSDDGEISIDVFDAFYNSSIDAIVPNLPIQRIFTDYIIPDASGEKWFNFTNINMNLDPSSTANNTFFIWLRQVSSTSTSRVQFHYANDGIDNVSVWFFGTGSTDWQLLSIDPSFKINLVPTDNNFSPSDLNLRINNSAVTNHPNSYNSGYWMSSIEFKSSTGLLGFIVSADWWDVSCTITFVQIAYTKKNVKANANFTVVGSGQEVLWNVTDSEGLNYLDSRIGESPIINFTIPISWNNINVFNGIINRTNDISIRALNNGYSEVHIMDAGTGNWFLTSSSVNLLESIDSYIGSRTESTFNYSNIAHFNASFKETIFQNDGLINLSIYSPALINDVLNFTLVKTMFGTGQEISLGDWAVSDNVTQYGVFRVQVSWYNKTAVGFMEAYLTIIGESDLILIAPPQDAIYDPNQNFNIVVYYEDVHLYGAINGATVNFNIANQGWESTTVDNGTTGFYLIPVNCSELISSGSKRVEITATREFYSNQTLEFLFEIIESTTTTTTTQPDTSTTTTTTTSTTSQADTSTSTTTTTTITTITEAGTFSGVLTVLAVFGTLVIFTRRRKKV